MTITYLNGCTQDVMYPCSLPLVQYPQLLYMLTVIHKLQCR